MASDIWIGILKERRFQHKPLSSEIWNTIKTREIQLNLRDFNSAQHWLSSYLILFTHEVMNFKNFMLRKLSSPIAYNFRHLMLATGAWNVIFVFVFQNSTVLWLKSSKKMLKMFKIQNQMKIHLMLMTCLSDFSL